MKPHAFRSAFVLALGLSVTAIASAERATFILSDGERMSGEIVFHTEARTNIREDKNEFNLKIASGTEVPIPFDHVVFIDFVGGQPRPEELAALPAGGHLITLRNGENRTGRLVDFIGGSTVKWDGRGGVTTLPITEVRRIFLKVDRVREMFNVPAAGPAAPPVTAAPTPPARGRITSRSRTVNVRGADAWTDSGISVRARQAISFSATGQIFYSRDPGASATPDGNIGKAARFPVPDMQVGGLIGKIGTNGKPFAIGANTEPILMPATGRLMLSVNDDDFSDNSGVFVVIVTP